MGSVRVLPTAAYLFIACGVVLGADAKPVPGAAEDRPVPPQAGLRAFLWGEGHAFSLEAPPGWVIDTSSGSGDGLPAVLYPEGSSWETARTRMYVTTARVTDDASLDAYIATDIAKQKQEGSPDLEVVRAEPIVLADGAKVRVNRLSHDRWSNWESVAYLEAPNVRMMIVLTSPEKKGHDEALPAFRTVVKSFLYKGTNYHENQPPKECATCPDHR